MEIVYTFTVKEVDAAARTAIVLYESDGLPPHFVSVRFPFVGESDIQVIKDHAPTYAWSLMKKPVNALSVGWSGEVIYNDAPTVPPTVLIEQVTNT